MNRNSNLLVTALVLSCLMFGKLSAQTIQGPDAKSPIFAEIISVFSASDSTDLNFGKFSPGPKGGRIILSPENTISVQGSVFNSGLNHSVARFFLTGDVNATYSISLPVEPVVLTHVTNGKTIQVEGWESIPSPEVGVSMLKNGYQLISIGATLKVGPVSLNPLGIYTGLYAITFDFN